VVGDEYSNDEDDVESKEDSLPDSMKFYCFEVSLILGHPWTSQTLNTVPVSIMAYGFLDL